MNALIIGASGGVGFGVAEQMVSAGHRVIAVARTEVHFPQLAAIQGAGSLRAITGTVGTERAAILLRDRVLQEFGELDAVVVSLNAPRQDGRRLIDQSAQWLTDVLDGNVVAHFIAARTFIPVLRKGGVYLAMGGGSADFVWPNFGHISMGQAALRMMFRVIAGEVSGQAYVRELLIQTIVNTRFNRETAKPEWLTADDIGRHCVSILERPREFAGPILSLARREEVGISGLLVTNPQ